MMKAMRDTPRQAVSDTEPLEEDRRKPVRRVMRALHRDVGFLLIGLTIVYCLSGIILVFRNTDFLKSAETIETTISAGLTGDQVGEALRLRHLRVTAEDEETIRFDDGVYNKQTGTVTYTQSAYPETVELLNRFHTQAGGTLGSVLATVYGSLLLFLAISAYWMYKPGSRLLKRGVLLSVGGAVVAIAVVVLV